MSETNLETKDGYTKKHIKTTFTTKKVFYILYMPVFKSVYEDIKKEFRTNNKTIDLSIGMIELPKLFGMGFIGLPDADGDTQIDNDFITYEMRGSYKGFKSAWDKIMKDYPKINEGYHFYHTDPTTTKEEDNKTTIAIR